MRFLGFRDVQNTPGLLWDALEGGATIVLTADGKPKALVIGVGEGDFEEILRDLANLRLMRAVLAAQAEAARTGARRLSEEEIEAEIRQARRERSR